MSFVSTSLERASQWNEICFPVRSVALTELLPAGYELLATDRQTAVVGEDPSGKFQIFALQGRDYSLIPNGVLREVVDNTIPDYTLDIHYSDRGEFSITIILPEQVAVGEEQIYKSLIINNSYSGKTPFTIQGISLPMQAEKNTRVSYYRSLCSNGLMGWADDFTSLSEYENWLRSGLPKLPRKTPSTGPGINESPTLEPSVSLQKKISHKKLNLEWFSAYLQEVIEQFLHQTHSVTAQLYSRLSKISPPGQVQTLIGETGIPKQLAKQALERLRKEEKMLKTEPSLWLIYNAINYSLLNSRSSLTINDRYEWDEKVLHHLAALTV